MNRSSLLHIVERLEGFLGKLPETIRKPILHELTPLKELFLQQRTPHLLFVGPSRTPIAQVIETLFASAISEKGIEVMESDHWQEVNLNDHGTISILDARNFEIAKDPRIQAGLSRQPADIILFLDDTEDAKSRKSDSRDLIDDLNSSESAARAKVLRISFSKRSANDHDGDIAGSIELVSRDLFLATFRFSSGKDPTDESRRLMSVLTREIPNEARIEMIRISRDRAAQHEVAQVLVRSTAAVCTAIGAQPIPLADLPILTTLQLMMVSGIMYLSGRERSLRAATEFIAALGANVGVGMLFREGTRALLKFFPGWGNVICGMVAGAGTYAIGRAAIVFFLEGVSLKDARRVYLKSRKRPERPQLPVPSRRRKTSKRRNK
jgi:uncharacterized protein (DUF697 family)